MTAQEQKNQLFSVGALFRCCLLLITSTLLIVGQSWGAESNVMTSLDVSAAGDVTTVTITTEKPLGHRYVISDLIDLNKVIIDFNDMDVDSIESLKNLTTAPVKSIDVTSFDLTSGQLSRVEIALTKLIHYDVSIDGTTLQLSFANVSAVTESSEDEVVVVEDEVVDAPMEAMAAAPVVVDDVELNVPASSAQKITGVDVGGSSVRLQADGSIEVFKYFSLGAPSRLVLDVYGIKAGFKQRVFDLGGDFSKIRVGSYDDKIRFVFDADGAIPDYSVNTQDNSVVVAWGDEADSSAVMTKSVRNGAPVNVEAVDFSIENGMSILRVTLNDPTAIIEASQKGDVVGFGVKNATITRALRRAVDASSFPSSIRLVTPYTVLVGEQQDVRFAVELKGPSKYELVEDGNTILFKVVNGPFAEPDPMTTQVAVDVPDVLANQTSSIVDSEEVVAVSDEVDVSTPMTDDQVVTDAAISSVVEDVELDEIQVLGGDQVKAYSGQRISLVFDNAEIRNILQLIAEVSNLNILAGDGVDGTITLRLIDVPWDQALDLILDTKDLGILRDGNVAKILPKESIRSMDEAKFSAKRTQEKLEDLSTEVIKISYTDLSNVTTPVKALLSTRGSVTEDSRNKQLIVTDIKSNIEKIRALATILDTPERQVLIEARIVEVDTTANLDLGVNWGISHSQTPTGGNYDSALSLGGAFTVSPSLGATGLGSAFQWGQVGVDTTILDLRLSALESKGDGRVVSNPRIMALNGELAKITQGTMIPYTVQTADGPNTEWIEAALSLEVTPVINPDNTVILVVKASNSSPTAGGSGAINKKEAETKMLVANGETMVIGGVFVESNNSSESGVPLLMDIPLLGNLFKSRNNLKTRTEMMVFITPRILQ